MRSIPDDDQFYALRRVPGRFYVSRRFTQVGSSHALPNARACRMAYQVFDSKGDVSFESDAAWELVVRETPTRQQVKAFFFEDTRRIARLAFQRFSRTGSPLKRQTQPFNLSGEEIDQLFAFLAVVTSQSQLVEGEEGVRLASHTVETLLAEEGLRREMYERYKPALLELIREDVTSPEVVALARRRQQVNEFERLLDDDEAFAARRDHLAASGEGRGPENVWQRFFEENRWIFGAGLAPQFLHAWDPAKLEQVVVGASAFGPGKRADGLLRTGGALSALVFVEIKSHQTPLLHPTRYRPGVWRVSEEVAGGMAQCQTQVDLTVERLRRQIVRRDSDGFDTDEWALVCRPRSLLVVGSLRQFMRDGRPSQEQFESFERFRRSVKDPEIVTFDELFARSRMVVDVTDPG